MAPALADRHGTTSVLEADLDHPEIVYVGGIRAKKSIDSGVYLGLM
jgi:hypothetical protein